jgi:hypothetical protein
MVPLFDETYAPRIVYCTIHAVDKGPRSERARVFKSPFTLIHELRFGVSTHPCPTMQYIPAGYLSFA